VGHKTLTQSINQSTNSCLQPLDMTDCVRHAHSRLTYNCITVFDNNKYFGDTLSRTCRPRILTRIYEPLRELAYR